MTAWGVVAVCAAGGVIAGPLLDGAARRLPLRRPAAAPDALGAQPSEVAAAVVAMPSPPAASRAAVVAMPASPEAGTVASPPVRAQQAASAVVTGGLWALAAGRLGAVPALAAYCALFATLVAVSITDLRTRLVPRRLLYPGLLVTGAALLAASADDGQWRALLDGAVGGAVAFALFAAVWWVYPKGMGFGDVRLAGLCGLGLGWLGYRQLYLGFLAAFFFGALVGVGMLVVRGARRLPFAPALAAGTAFGVLWGGWLGNLWLHPG